MNTLRYSLMLSLVLGCVSAASAQSTFVVTTTDDSGAGSLRQALFDANAMPGADLIHFAIPGGGPHTIQPLSALPSVTDPVTIDGFTQPGAAPNTAPITEPIDAVLLIELDGSNTGSSDSGIDLAAGSDGSTIRGLVINRFGADGIGISDSEGHVIAGTFIGSDVAGTTARGNGDKGIDNRSGNGLTIGGPTPGARNLISGNADDGIEMDPDSGAGETTSDNVIQGNFIGVDATGAAALGNGGNGVALKNASANNTVGGEITAARNVISGNMDNGVFLRNQLSTGNRILGNYIGTDATGTVALSNAFDGIRVEAPDNTIGGAAPGAGNVISGNTDDGVHIEDSEGVVVQGNYVGTDPAGTLALGNGNRGVNAEGAGSTNNTIGGTVDGAANTIAFNAIGVTVRESATTGNAIRGNRIFRNAGLGIDLGDDGQTANDPGDADDGPNRFQNFPEIVSATSNGGMLTVIYAVPSAAAHSAYPLAVDLYLAADGEEEGEVYLGSVTYEAADAEGIVTVSFAPASPIGDGDRVVATATDGDGNTSEFSSSPVVVPNESDAPSPAAALHAPAPNPFATRTMLRYDVAEVGPVRIAVYDLLGREVAVLVDEERVADQYEVELSGRSLASGVYLVQMTVGDRLVQTQRIALLR